MGRWEWTGKLGRFHRRAGAVLTEILGTGRSPTWAEIEGGGGGYHSKISHPGLFLEQAGD